MRRVARIRAPDKQALPFYLSSEWRGLMRRLIEERGRRCEKCRANGNDLWRSHRRTEGRRRASRSGEHPVVVRLPSYAKDQRYEARAARSPRLI